MLADVLPVVLVSRLLFAALTLLVPMWRALTGQPAAPIRTATGTILDAWNRSDVLWYTDLARLGYNQRGPDGFTNLVFFPLFPLLTRTLHDAMATVWRDVLGLALSDPFHGLYLISGMIVANACTIGALMFFHNLVRLDYGRAAARRAVVLLGLSPLSLFLFTAYSEGPFLLCTIAFFYALRLERWWQAGLWGLLAAATRPPGAVLLIPFLMAWVAAHPVAAGSLAARLRLAGRALAARLRVRVQRLAPQPATYPPRPAPAVLVDISAPALQGRTPRRRAGDLSSTRATPGPRLLKLPRPSDWTAEHRRAFFNILPVVAIPLGLALFMIFLFKVWGDPLLFSRAQKAWWRTFAPPWETLFISAAWPLGDVLQGKVTVADAYALQDLCYEIGGLALTIVAWRRLPRVQVAYMWLLWIVTLSSPAMLPGRPMGEPHHDVLMSLPRLLLMMFPLFTLLSLSRRAYPWLTGLSVFGMVIYTSLFLSGGWVA